MSFRRALFRALVPPLIAAFVVAMLPHGRAMAGLVPTERVVVGTPAEIDRAALLSTLERDDVRRELVAQGVDPDEATARVVALSDTEVRQLAGMVGDDPAGQGLGGAIIFGLIVGLLIVLIFRVAGR
jgi:hypothetical protein